MACIVGLDGKFAVALIALKQGMQFAVDSSNIFSIYNNVMYVLWIMVKFIAEYFFTSKKAAKFKIIIMLNDVEIYCHYICENNKICHRIRIVCEFVRNYLRQINSDRNVYTVELLAASHCPNFGKDIFY